MSWKKFCSLCLTRLVRSFALNGENLATSGKKLKQIEKCFSQCKKSEMSKINSFQNWPQRREENWLIGSEQTTGMSTPGRGESRRL
jgi:hypothetical protein